MLQPTNLSNLNVEGQQEVKFMASYASSLNANYGLGSTLVVATAGSVSISGGKLFLGSGTGNYIRYDAKGNANFTQTGAIKFKLTPNYSGTPSTNAIFINIGTPSTTTNGIWLYHGDTGYLIIIYQKFI